MIIKYKGLIMTATYTNDIRTPLKAIVDRYKLYSSLAEPNYEYKARLAIMIKIYAALTCVSYSVIEIYTKVLIADYLSRTWCLKNWDFVKLWLYFLKNYKKMGSF